MTLADMKGEDQGRKRVREEKGREVGEEGSKVIEMSGHTVDSDDSFCAWSRNGTGCEDFRDLENSLD